MDGSIFVKRVNDKMKRNLQKPLSERFLEIKRTRTRIRDYRMAFHRMECRLGTKEITVIM